nr:MAG TPA: hypothetical protein [Caudoviricetes sp.]
MLAIQKTVLQKINLMNLLQFQLNKVSASGWTSSLVIKHLERDSSNILEK